MGLSTTTLTISLIVLTFLTPLFIFPTQGGGIVTGTLYLYVDGYSEESRDPAWYLEGAIPYLNGTDYPVGNLNFSSTPPFVVIQVILNFTFENIPHSYQNYTITDIDLQTYVRNYGYTSTLYCYLYSPQLDMWTGWYEDNSWYYNEEFQWFTCDENPTEILDVLDSHTEINGTKLQIGAVASATHADKLVDCVRLVIEYEYYQESWEDVEVWYFSLATDISWHFVERWSIGIGELSLYFFDICFFLMFFGFGGMGVAILSFGVAIKNKNSKLFISAISIASCCFLIILYYGGAC